MSNCFTCFTCPHFSDLLLILSLQVLTFDEGGVSGHANHIAIYKALR